MGLPYWPVERAFISQTRGGRREEEAKSDVLEVGAVVFTAGDLKGVYVKNKLKVVKVFRQRKRGGDRDEGTKNTEERLTPYGEMQCYK